MEGSFVHVFGAFEGAEWRLQSGGSDPPGRMPLLDTNPRSRRWRQYICRSIRRCRSLAWNVVMSWPGKSVLQVGCVVQGAMQLEAVAAIRKKIEHHLQQRHELAGHAPEC